MPGRSLSLASTGGILAKWFLEAVMKVINLKLPLFFSMKVGLRQIEMKEKGKILVGFYNFFLTRFRY